MIALCAAIKQESIDKTIEHFKRRCVLCVEQDGGAFEHLLKWASVLSTQAICNNIMSVNTKPYASWVWTNKLFQSHWCGYVVSGFFLWCCEGGYGSVGLMTMVLETGYGSVGLMKMVLETGYGSVGLIRMVLEKGCSSVGLMMVGAVPTLFNNARGPGAHYLATLLGCLLRRQANFLSQNFLSQNCWRPLLDENGSATRALHM